MGSLKEKALSAAAFVSEFLVNERHIKENSAKTIILQTLKETGEFDILVNNFVAKCIELMMSGLKDNSNDRQSIYKIKCTFLRSRFVER